jgi:hypothetical protein
MAEHLNNIARLCDCWAGILKSFPDFNAQELWVSSGNPAIILPSKG